MERKGFDRRQNHRLALPLGVSLAVHVLALSFYLSPFLAPFLSPFAAPSEPARSASATPVLTLELQRQQSPTQPVAPAVLPATSTAAKPKPDVPESMVGAIGKETLTPPAKDLPKPIVSEAPNHTRDLSAEFASNYIRTPCTPAQRASKMRNCDDRDTSITPQPDDQIAWVRSLFEADALANKDFSADMKLVDELLEKSAALDQLTDKNAVGAHFIATQQRHIREEIVRIDKKYTRVNLLEVLPRTLQVVRGFGERLREQRAN